MNSSSVSVRWDRARGEFDFHRVTVANASVTHTFTVPREEQGAVVTGLVEGCSYNVSAERVRGVTAGSAASLTVTTGRRYYKGTSQRPGIITCLHHFLIKFPRPLTVFFSLSLFPSLVPARVRGVHLTNVSACAFTLHWDQAVGCVDHYQVNLQPNQGKVIVYPARDGYVQVNTHAP